MEAMSQARVRPVEYPESDGLPMAETDEHADELRTAIDTLRDHLSQPVYVAGNNFLYWVEGDSTFKVSPDCYVVRGLTPQKRRVFRTWVEGAKPAFVLELTSDGTRRNDMGDKMSIYRDDLQVPEYFLFDLTRDWILEGLRGYRLVGRDYAPIEPGVDGRLMSESLGLELAPVGRELRFFRPGARESLPRRLEQVQQERARTEQERARAEQERTRADAAEAEVRRLREELERLRGE